MGITDVNKNESVHPDEAAVRALKAARKRLWDAYPVVEKKIEALLEKWPPDHPDSRLAEILAYRDRHGEDPEYQDYLRRKEAEADPNCT